MLNLLRFAALLSVFLVSCWPAEAATPAAQAIALRRADLPAQTYLDGRFTHYYSSAQLNGDTVPYGLSVRGLRSAGFRGLYTQGFVRAYDANIYSWQYLAFATPAAAHRTYLHWARAFKYPFTQPAGAASVGDEGRYYNVVSISEGHVGLLVRSGPFVILGHFYGRSGVTRLMRIVVARTRPARP